MFKIFMYALILYIYRKEVYSMITREELEAKIKENKEYIFNSTFKSVESTVDEYLLRAKEHSIPYVTIKTWYPSEMLPYSDTKDCLVLYEVPIKVIDAVHSKYSEGGHNCLKDLEVYTDTHGYTELRIYVDDDAYDADKKNFDSNGGHFISRDDKKSSYLYTEINSPIFRSKKHWWEFWK